MASETITRNDLTAILNSVLPNPADMTPQEVEDFIDSLLGQGSNIADFVVEADTDGIWTYRKWNSGIAECWGIYTTTKSHYSTGNGTYGYNSGEITFPDGLFDSAPTVTVDGSIGNGFYLGSIPSNVSATKMEVVAMSTASGSVACVYNIHAIGKWK